MIIKSLLRHRICSLQALIYKKINIESRLEGKIWITKTGKCLLCNNNSKIPNRMLRDIMDVIEARSNNDSLNFVKIP